MRADLKLHVLSGFPRRAALLSRTQESASREALTVARTRTFFPNDQMSSAYSSA